MSVNKARFLINGLAVAALLISLLVRNELLAAALVLACLVSALALLYRNLAQMSNVSPDSPRLKTLRGVTVFNVVFIVTVVVFAVLLEKGVITLTDTQSKYAMAIMLAVLMMGLGNVAPKLPFSRYTGLRLPWTVRDEDTWVVAHRILGYISFPMGLLCLTGATSRIPFDTWVKVWFVGPLLVWIGIPAVLSGVFYWRKWRV